MNIRSVSESNEKTVKMSLNSLAAAAAVAKNTTQQMNSKHVNNNDYLKETKMPLRSVAGIATRPIAMTPIGSGGGLVGGQPHQHQQPHVYGILAPPPSSQQRLVGQSRSLLSMNNTSLSIIEDKNESSEERSSSAVNVVKAMLMGDDNQGGGFSDLEPNTSSIFSGDGGGGGGASLSKSNVNLRYKRWDLCSNSILQSPIKWIKRGMLNRTSGCQRRRRRRI